MSLSNTSCAREPFFYFSLNWTAGWTILKLRSRSEVSLVLKSESWIIFALQMGESWTFGRGWTFMQPRHLAPDYKVESWRPDLWNAGSGAPTNVMFWLNFQIEWQTQNGLQMQVMHQKWIWFPQLKCETWRYAFVNQTFMQARHWSEAKAKA